MNASKQLYINAIQTLIKKVNLFIIYKCGHFKESGRCETLEMESYIFGFRWPASALNLPH